MKKIVLFSILLLVTILSMSGILFALVTQMSANCIVEFGGTTCYNREGTQLGFTPDQYSQTQAIQRAQASEYCIATLSAITPTVSSPSDLYIVVVVPIAIVYDDLTLTITSRRLFCGDRIRVLGNISIDETLWYLVYLNSSEDGWINATDVQAEFLNIEAPFITLTATTITP